MKKTKLSIFYHLGEALEDLHALRIGMTWNEAIMSMIQPRQWLIEFYFQIDKVPMSDSRKSADTLIRFLDPWVAPTGPIDLKKTFTQDEMLRLHKLRDKFVEDFEREEARLGVFIVTRKGLYDTNILLESPEEAFDEKIRGLLPEQTLEDFKQAARCLAFEIPTACAFHVCRGTEALMLGYYEKLTGHPWALPKNKDWSAYITHLAKEGAPEKITSRLEEIRRMDRNAYIHPDINVPLAEAPVLFKLCEAVIFYMTQEIERLTP